MKHAEMMAMYSAEWAEDCAKWRGKTLTGQHAHWCPSWDFLPIDETSMEWPCDCAEHLVAEGKP